MVAVRAAEQFSVFYPPFLEVSISVQALEIFAESGEITGELGFYARFFSPEDLASARQVLNRRFDISHVALSQFTYSPIGDRLVRNLSRVLLNGDEEAHVRALRGALVVAAAEPEGLSVLGFLRRIPFERVRVDLDLSIQAVNAAIEILSDTETAIAQVQAQSLATESASDAAGGEQLLALRSAGGFQVQQQQISFFHPQRGIPVVADVYVPQGLLPQPQDLLLPDLGETSGSPVVVISHGIASNRKTFAYLAQHLASHGFGVGVLEHPGTDSARLSQFLAGFDQLPGTEEWLHRPQDISHLLDAMAADPQLSPMLDLDRVGLIGQSLGGYTVLAAAGALINRPTLLEQCSVEGELSFNLSLLLQCRATELLASPEEMILRDPRVRGVLAINPISSTLFGQTGLAQIEIPTMLIASGDDFFAPPLTEQIRPFGWLTTEQRYLVLVERGTHFSFLGGRGQGVLPVPPLLVGPDPILAFPQLQALSLAFLRATVQDREDYGRLLNPRAVAELNAESLRLSLVREDVLADVLDEGL
jgi:predicted dienelactone hydrolase